MTRDLYRKEAFQSRIKGFSNPVSIRGSLSGTLTTLGLLALLGALAIYGYVTDYTRKVSAPGFVAPSSGSIEIESPVSGVAEISVENGARIEDNAVLATVTDTLDSAGIESDIALELKSLRRRRDLISERIALSEKRLGSARETYEMRLRNGERQIDSRKRILDMQSQERELVVAARDRAQEMLDREIGTEVALEEARATVVATNQRRIDAEAALAEARETLETTRVERDIEIASLEDEIIALRAERLSIEGQIETLENQKSREIRAPIGGVVTFAQARNFERVNAGEPLFTIDPVDEDFVATLLAPSSAIGFVKPGDEVRLRYEAYPYREHGVFTGTVTAIDNTAQVPTAFSAPIGGEQPVYRITAEIDQAPVNKQGEALELFSNMVFEGSIIADEKPILFWLLDPIL